VSTDWRSAVEPTPRVVLDEVGSTNTEAMARALAGERGPLWIVARRQTKGRGRGGRHWVSEPGNLYASLLTRLACPAPAVQQLSLLAAVAVFDGIAAHSTPLVGLRLKWPNDLLIGGAKVAGILPESSALAGTNDVVAVIGVGVNLAWSPTNLARPATHLAAHGLAVAPEPMLDAIDRAMVRWLAIWHEGANFARVREAWLERAGPVGERIRVDTGREILSGAFLGLDEAGLLVLGTDDGLERRLTFGEVTLPAAREGG
jgi:BirA family biotin operon repressor/biotin-[acetyl-CoA-carboxylase] ligase